MTTTETPRPLLLIAEEDPITRSFLAENLAADGYRLLAAGDRRQALTLLDAHEPDLLICDLNGETLTVLDAVRRADGLASRIDPATPLIVLTSRGDELARVRVFDHGGDDVLVKPFSYPELRARVAALLRRASRDERAVLHVGPLALEPRSRGAWLRGEPLALSNLEYQLLSTLAGAPTRVFTKDELMRTIWGIRAYGRTRTLDSHACRLRAKLADPEVRFVINVWGVGYRLLGSSPAPAPALAAA
jgi:DNA-binding response OmpR family regulator